MIKHHYPEITRGQEGYVLPSDDGNCCQSLFFEETDYGIPYCCTRPMNHAGKHVAHGTDNAMYASWWED